MGRIIKEYVTYWGTSLSDWGDGTQQRFVVERDEDLLKNGVLRGGRRMEKLSLDEILKPGVVTGVDMENGYGPLALYGNEDLIIEVANCDEEQGGWHRNIGADEWAFQYRGSRTIRSEVGEVTIGEGEMTVIPQGVSHQNVADETNIEITIYTRKPLKRLAPLDPEDAREQMRYKDGAPLRPPVTLEHANP